MRCAKARRIIHLNRKGEAPPGVLRVALEHAATCPDCSAERDMIARADAVIGGLRAKPPILNGETDLAMRIMREVVAKRARSPHAFVADRFLRRLQAATAFALVLIAALFAVQSYDDARMQEALEARLSEASSGTVARSSISSLSEDRKISAGLAEELLAGTADRQLQAGSPFGNALGTLFDLLQRGSRENEPEMDRLRARYPDLWSISLADGLDRRERAILRTEGKAFLQELHTLITLAEPLHEK